MSTIGRRQYFYSTHYLTKPLTLIVLLPILWLSSCIEDKVDPLLIGSIRGHVLSKGTGLPIAEVEISTAPVTSVVFTDNNGEFKIENVPEGEYTIITKAEGYTRESIKVNVLRNATSEISIKLVTSNILAPSPKNPVPANADINQALTLSLRWSVDRNHNDSLKYTVKVFEATQTIPYIKIQDIADTTLTLQNLKYNTTYYWQVDVVSSTNNVTSGDIWSFKTIPFPDNRIVFTTYRDGNYELYSTNPEGSELVRLTYTTAFEVKPLLSKNRDRIAFISNPGMDYHIYTMNKEGLEMRRVTTLPVVGYHNQGNGFSWSPDNGKFIYSHYDKLYRIDNDGVNLTQLATAPDNRNFRGCHWTDVGKKIVVETVGPLIYDSEIYTMNEDGSDTVRLVNNLPGIIESPSFTIDGKGILFTRDVSGFESADGRQLDAHVFLIDIETLEVNDLSAHKPAGTNDLRPQISPDGAQVIFVNAANDGTGKKSIWIMDIDGSSRRKVVDDADMPHWQ